jgi:predicted metal-dependent enzyme (double-stranded beta helix superfamily)
VRRARALAEEAGSLVKSGRKLRPDWLGPAAAWLAADAPAWEDMSGAIPKERSYRLLASSLQLEAWLICWPPGGRLALHDHGGASGALQVVRGDLYEGFVSDGGTRVRSRALSAGEGVAFDGDYLHDVANRGADLTTTVHLYGPASTSMSFYRLHPSSRRPMPISVPPG